MDNSTIAAVIVGLRKDRGYKRAVDLAEAAGINITTLQNVESGRKKTLDSDMITALCLTLQVSPYVFLPGLNRTDDPTERHAVAVARLELMNKLIGLDSP